MDYLSLLVTATLKNLMLRVDAKNDLSAHETTAVRPNLRKMVVSGRRVQSCPRSKGIHIVSPTCNLSILDRYASDKPAIVSCAGAQNRPVHLHLQGNGPA